MVLTALINIPDGLNATMQYIVASVLRQGRIEGVAMGRAIAWNEVRGVVVDEMGDEALPQGIKIKIYNILDIQNSVIRLAICKLIMYLII